MELQDIASVVAPSGLVEQVNLVQLFSYCAVTDDKVRALMPAPPFPTQPRSGGGGGSFTWDEKKKGSAVTLSNKNLTALSSGSSWNGGLVLGTRKFEKGNHYWEIKIDHSTSDMIGVAKPDVNPNQNSVYSNAASQIWFAHHSSGIYGSVGTKTSISLSTKTGDVIGVGLEWEEGTKTFALTYYKNRTKLGTPFRQIPPPVVAACELYSTPARVTLDPKARQP